MANIPKHIAIIMDGNGRWAQAKEQPRIYGHEHGVEAARDIVLASADRGVRTLTLFAFSTENQRRPQNEIIELMELFARSLQDEVGEWLKYQIRLRFIGSLSFFGANLCKKFDDIENKTADMQRMLLNVAVNYSGRWDILNATREIISQKLLGSQTITEELMNKQLLIDDVDLLIRTGGERRISNFMLWQSAYAELYFSDSLWPDFSVAELDEAICWYSQRERRFGHLSEQA